MNPHVHHIEPLKKKNKHWVRRETPTTEFATMMPESSMTVPHFSRAFDSPIKQHRQSISSASSRCRTQSRSRSRSRSQYRQTSLASTCGKGTDDTAKKTMASSVNVGAQRSASASSQNVIPSVLEILPTNNPGSSALTSSLASSGNSDTPPPIDRRKFMRDLKERRDSLKLEASKRAELEDRRVGATDKKKKKSSSLSSGKRQGRGGGKIKLAHARSAEKHSIGSSSDFLTPVRSFRAIPRHRSATFFCEGDEREDIKIDSRKTTNRIQLGRRGSGMSTLSTCSSTLADLVWDEEEDDYDYNIDDDTDAILDAISMALPKNDATEAEVTYTKLDDKHHIQRNIKLAMSDGDNCFSVHKTASSSDDDASLSSSKVSMLKDNLDDTLAENLTLKLTLDEFQNVAYQLRQKVEHLERENCRLKKRS